PVVPELPGPVVPEDPKPPGLPVPAIETIPVSPAMAKRGVIIFHIMAVLRVWAAHTSLLASSDLGLVCHPSSFPAQRLSQSPPSSNLFLAMSNLSLKYFGPSQVFEVQDQVKSSIFIYFLQ
ncbi:hypothetical protein PO909_025359, partial [Leuciscus waleckii]